MKTRLQPQIFPSPVNGLSQKVGAAWEGYVTQRLSEVLERVDTADDWIGQLPIVRWDTSERAPCALSIYLICRGHHTVEIDSFFSDMIRWWLLPGQQLAILASHNHLFSVPEQAQTELFFSEVLVNVKDGSELHAMLHHLPDLAEEIRLGVSSPEHARAILDGKAVSSDHKIRLMFQWLIALRSRRPRDFSPELLRETQKLLLVCSEQYRSIRSPRHLCRIVCTHHLFRRTLARELSHLPDKRHLLVRLLRTYLSYPFGRKQALGIVVSLNLDRQHEQFDQKHVLQAAKRFVPSARVVHNSFVSLQESYERISNLYVEIEKESGEDFTTEELLRLRRDLPNELKGHVEQISQSIFMNRNEEDVIRSILTLSNELRFVRDLPQVMIWFQKQSPQTLTFKVVLVRLASDDSTPIHELLNREVEGAKFSIECVRSVGQLRKKYSKEATVFDVEISKEGFLRQDYSINLYQARQFVSGVLSQMVGEIRDFNGGLIVKQNELLAAVKRIILPQQDKHEYVLENFFYSLAPVEMQSYLQPKQIAKLFDLLLELLPQEPKRKDDYWLTHAADDHATFVMLRAENDGCRQAIRERIDQLQIDILQLATSEVKIHGSYFLGYLFLVGRGCDSERFVASIQQAMKEWHRSIGGHQVIRINLPREASSLDPRIGTDRRSGVLMKMLYEGLMRNGQEGTPLPALAEDVHISDDRCTYTFQIRETEWSNGIAVTAHDFEYAWKKILTPNFHAQFSYLFFPIKNAKAAKKGQAPINALGVHASDDQTLVVELEHPAPYFLDLTAHWTYSPLCSAIDRLHPGWAYGGGQDYVCNGPFMLAESKAGSDLRVVKNPHYWDADSVQLEEIQIAHVTNPHTALSMFEEDRLDWIGDPISDLPPDAFYRLQRGTELQSRPSGGLVWYCFNAKAFPFTCTKIRQAFAYSIDRHRICQEVLRGEEQSARSVLAPHMQLHKDPPFPDNALDRASQLFEEGLKELGIDRSDLPAITINFSSSPRREMVAANLKRQWEQAFGIPIKLEGLPWSGYVSHILSHEYQICDLQWFTWFNDPIYNLEFTKFRLDHVNMTRWEHPKYIELLDQSNFCFVEAERNELLRQAELLLAEEAPIVPVFYSCYHFAKKERLRGVYVSDLGRIDFKWAYIQ